MEVHGSEEQKEHYLRQVPLKKFGTVEDVARAVLFLAVMWGGGLLCLTQTLRNVVRGLPPADDLLGVERPQLGGVDQGAYEATVNDIIASGCHGHDGDGCD